MKTAEYRLVALPTTTIGQSFFWSEPRGRQISSCGLSIYDLDGKLEPRATNGPISLQGFSGDANISAENGPIDLVGNSGKLRLHTENGPISVSLSGDGWKGSGLEADAQNGPGTLRVPKNYQSSLLVESDGHSPMSCPASFCNDARKTWDEDRRRIEFGNVPAVIHYRPSTGPLPSNKDRRDGKASF